MKDCEFEAYKGKVHQMDVHLLDAWQVELELETCYDLMADFILRNDAGEDEDTATPSLEYLDLRARIQYLEARRIEEVPFSVRGKSCWQLTSAELREELELRRKAFASGAPDACRQYQADIRKILKELEIRDRPVHTGQITEREE